MPIDLRRAHPARPRIWWIVIGVLAFALVLLTVAVHYEWAPVVDLDEAVADWAYDLGSGHETWIDFWTVVQNVSRGVYVTGLLTVVAIVFLVRRQYRMVLWLLATGVLSWLAALFAKGLLERPRPSWAQPLIEIGGTSYPSGHALGAGVLTTTMILVTVVSTARGPIRYALIALWSAVGALICADRIFLDVHWLSDVVAGALLGSLFALVPWVLAMQAAVDGILPRITTTGTGSKRVAVVFNPIKVGDNAVFRHQVREAAAVAGWRTPTFYETTIEDPGTSMAHRALEAGVDLVLVAGGDGTVRVVCTELARTGVAIGVIPLGTGNLLARNLGIPLHKGDAIEVAFNGQDRAVDVARFRSADASDDEDAPESFTDTSFMVMAGLGLDAAIMNGVADEMKAKMGWLAYVVSAFRQLRYPAVKVEISVDDGEFERYRARTVVVGNVGQLQGGIPLLPDATIDDGKIDVVVIAPPRAWSWVRLVVRVLTRRRRTDEKLDRLTGRKVVVRAERPTPRQLDGDPIGEGTEFTAEVQPGVLLIRVPS
ncbi:diacylglycerol kinase family protein [Solicola gregarius]|uniref:Phosphatase PAP2 family protein n=1 Tax=Solicola gregarius TaxID=2908642 RepID=A0AA46TM06_9ACTN|nr:diacylglycerol kinase family protein [Solicola gregarius]UYM07593.1 phosphatase PAP2 family protein [Solicola gregarius]